MTTELPTGRIRYAERRVVFYRDEAEQWLKDHHEAQECQGCEDFIRDINQLLVDIRESDRQLHEAYCEGLPYDESLSARLAELFQRWYDLAQRVEIGASEFEKKDYMVEGLGQLRRRIHETEAVLNPSDEVGGIIANLRDKAIQSHERGEVLEGLV